MTPKSSALPVGPTSLELHVQSARVANRDAEHEGTRLSWRALAALMTVAKREGYAQCLEDLSPKGGSERINIEARNRYADKAAVKYPLHGLTLDTP